MRGAWVLGLFVVIATGCGRSGFGPGSESGAEPPGTTPTPESTPAAAPWGDGTDGPWNAGVEVVNVCHPLLSANGETVSLASAGGLATGNTILVWQVQDSFALAGDPADVTSAAGAGRWEITRVTQLAGTTVNVDPPVGAYGSDALRRAQACRVPQFTDVTVADDARIRAEPWNGETGGVVAFFVSGTLDLAGEIDASARGFRGGRASADSMERNFLGLSSIDPDDGGGKGEGLDPSALGFFARGNIANGGGGGNAHNAGGGGGGSAGAGGWGGAELENDGGDLESRGMFGARVALPFGALVPGGGGGGGHQSEGRGPSGGTGGGVILVFARTLTGDGRIRADGADASPLDSRGDGGGGGGAGGTIDLRLETAATFAGELSALGGRGADTELAGSGARHGPGGGGGGGLVRWSAPLATDAEVFVDGGLNGAARGGGGGDDDDDDTGDPWFAEPGADGVVLPP